MKNGASKGLIGPREAVVLIALLWTIYALVFALTDQHSGAANIAIWALCNALPLVLLAVPLIDRLAPRIARAAIGLALAQAALAVFIYALVSYGAIVFLLALTSRVESEGIFVTFFAGRALPWQLFQGVAYGASAVFAGLWFFERRTVDLLVSAQAQASDPSVPGTPSRPRWLVKTADGIVSIDPAELIRIEAAGEYSFLILAGKRHLSRISIGQCESRLDRQGFLRVHRSHLINSDRLVAAEIAGNGRLQLTLSNGDQILTSRQGAKLVRSAAV